MIRNSILAFCALLFLASCGQSIQKTAEALLNEQLRKEGSDATVSLDGEQVVVNTEDGSFVAGSGTKLPSNFPNDVLIYPGASLVSSLVFPEGINLTFQTSDTPEKVATSYKSSLESQGWKTEYNLSQSDTIVLAFSKGKRAVQISASASSGSTSLNLSVTENK